MPRVLNKITRWNVFLRLLFVLLCDNSNICFPRFSFVRWWNNLFNFLKYFDYFSFYLYSPKSQEVQGFCFFFAKTIRSVFRMKHNSKPWVWLDTWLDCHRFLRMEAEFCSRVLVSQGGSARSVPPRRRTHSRSVNYSLSDKNTGFVWGLHNCRVLSADQNVSAAQLFIYLSVHALRKHLCLICFAEATSAEKPYGPPGVIKVRWNFSFLGTSWLLRRWRSDGRGFQVTDGGGGASR